MNNQISLTDALKIINAVDVQGRSIPFDISFRTLNRNSKKGGSLYDYMKVVKYRKEQSTPNYKSMAQSSIKQKRNPNHFKNRTINLELQNREIKTIHLRLIISLNGQKVIY